MCIYYPTLTPLVDVSFAKIVTRDAGPGSKQVHTSMCRNKRDLVDWDFVVREPRERWKPRAPDASRATKRNEQK